MTDKIPEHVRELHARLKATLASPEYTLEQRLSAIEESLAALHARLDREERSHRDVYVRVPETGPRGVSRIFT